MTRPIGAMIVFWVLVLGMIGTVAASEKVTICHAAGQEGTDHYIELTIGWNAVYGPAGHFFENGTPRAGHEEDYLGPCNTTTTTSSTTSTTESTTTSTDGSTTTTTEPTTTTATTTPPSTTSTTDPTTTTTPSSTTQPPTSVITSTSVPPTILPYTGIDDLALYAGYAIALLSAGGLIVLAVRRRR